MNQKHFLVDRIYGGFQVPELIIELIHSKPFQRLKGIHQGGAIFLIDPEQNHTRFDHSIGVYWLITKFGGSIEERVAGLLHDISHTAFSHVADYVIGQVEEDYHEAIFEAIINESEIPQILSNYKVNISFSDFTKYSLVEQPLPALCADRLDYTLRDLYQANMINLNQIKTFIADLSVVNGQFKISTAVSLSWFKDQYNRLNADYFRRPEHLFANEQLTEILRTALKDKKISLDDLLKTDKDLIAMLNVQGYFEALDNLSRLKGFKEFDVSKAAAKIKIRKL